MMATYTYGVLAFSLGGHIEQDLIGSPSPFLNGAVLALFPVAVAIARIASGSLPPRVSLIVGCLVSILGMELLMLAVGLGDLAVYLLATIVAGGAYSLLFVGELQAISEAAPLRHRAGTLSGLYLLGYLSMGTLALLFGAIATAWARSRGRPWRCSDHLDESSYAGARCPESAQRLSRKL
jgi:MFS family permease